MRALFALLLAMVAGCSRGSVPPPGSAPRDACVVVRIHTSGCEHEETSEHVLQPSSDRFLSEEIDLSHATVVAARAIALAAPESVPDMLAQLGIDRATLEERVPRIAHTLFKHSGHSKRHSMAELNEVVRRSLSAELIGERLEDVLLDRRGACTEARTVEITLPGDPAVRLAIDEDIFNMFVPQAWDLAGFEARPEFQVLLRREGKWAATMFLAGLNPRGLITAANPLAGPHWLDALDLHFHPTTPELAYVDAAGEPHVVR